MSRFTITDQTVHAAFDLLERNVDSAAVAAAMRERREDERKAAKARAFQKSTGTVAEREAAAVLDPDYRKACESYYEAVEADIRCRKEESKCQAIIDAWRTCQSNQRNMARVG